MSTDCTVPAIRSHRPGGRDVACTDPARYVLHGHPMCAKHVAERARFTPVEQVAATVTEQHALLGATDPAVAQVAAATVEYLTEVLAVRRRTAA